MGFFPFRLVVRNISVPLRSRVDEEVVGSPLKRGLCLLAWCLLYGMFTARGAPLAEKARFS